MEDEVAYFTRTVVLSLWFRGWLRLRSLLRGQPVGRSLNLGLVLAKA